jgi:hypothetical protein
MAVVGEPNTALARWMGEWTGLRHVVIGMTARGDNAELREYPLGWWANFSWTGRAHTVGLGSGGSRHRGARWSGRSGRG